MSYLKTTLCLAFIGVLTACTGASTEQSASHSNEAHAGHEPAAKGEGQTYISTVKPGASVSLNSVLPKSMTPGSFQPVELNFSEAYNDGTMNIRIVPSEGLELFGGSASKTFDMSTSGAHVWDLDVKAETDGIYVLNIFAEAQNQARSFSVRLNIGQVTQKMFDEALPAEGTLVEGGNIRVLDATETIE